MKDWEMYEEQIFNKFNSKYKDCTIIKNYKKIGKYSKSTRQIDIAIEGEVAGFKQFGVIECKCYNKKIDVKTVDSLIGFREDVEADFVVLITNKGFTEGAKNRAENARIHIDIIDINYIEEYEFEPPTTTCRECEPKIGINYIDWNKGKYNNFELGKCCYCGQEYIKCSCGEVLSTNEALCDIIECYCGKKYKIIESHEDGLLEYSYELLKERF